jgi:hypothetical protein
MLFSSPNSKVLMSTNRSWTLLHEAADRGRRENVVELLSGAGRDANFREVNAVDVYRKTALHHACRQGHTGVVEELVEGAGREVGFVAFAAQDMAGETALHYAQNQEIVGLLLRGASRVGEEERHTLVHTRTTNGRTVMQLDGPDRGLLAHCSDDELDFLLITKNDEGHNALHDAAYYCSGNGIRNLLRGMRERMESRGAGGMAEQPGLTALHLAIAFRSEPSATDLETVRALLAPAGEGLEIYVRGVDPNVGCNGRTAHCGLFWERR